ncbi:MAG: hypothetical protein ABJC13_06655 [Acidobacteriota bacterium]
MRRSPNAGPWTAQGTSRWHAWDDSYFARLVGLACLGGLLFLRFAERRGGLESSFVPVDRLALDPAWRPVLALLLVANAIVLHRSLAARTPGARALPVVLRALLAALAALPVVGLHAWPAWRRLGRDTDEGIPRLDLGVARRGPPLVRLDRLLARLRTDLGFLVAWTVAGQVVPFLALLAALAAPPPAGLAGTRFATAAHVLLQIAGFVSTWIYAPSLPASRLRRAFHQALPFTFFLPGAWPLAALGPWVLAAREGREETTFVFALWQNRRRTAPIPLEPNRAERRRDLYTGIAVVLLPFETAPVGALLAKSGEIEGARLAMAIWLVLSMAVAAAYVVKDVIQAGPMARRGALIRALPRAILLSVAPGLALIGLEGGALWASHAVPAMISLAVYSGALGALVLLLTALLDYTLRLPDPEGGGLRVGTLLIGMIGGFALAVGIALLARTRSDLLPPLLPEALAARVVLLATLGSNALKPVRLADLADRHLPRSTRLSIAALVAAVALPFGGLALPALALLPRGWRTRLARRLLRARAEALPREIDVASPSAGSTKERAQRIARRRFRARIDLRGGGPWRHFELGDSAFVSSMLLLVGGLVGESQLWPRGYAPITIEPQIANLLGAASLAFLPLQAWIADGYLEAKTPFPRTLPRLWIAARRIASAIPGLGLVLIPAWRRFVERRMSAIPPLDLGAAARQTPRSDSGLRLGVPAVAAALSVLPLIGLSIWLAVQAPFPVAVVVLAALHVGAALLLRQELAEKVATEPARPGPRRERDLFPLLVLLPAPFSILPVVLRIFLPAERRSETLVGSAYGRRTSDTNEPLEVALARSPSAPTHESRAEKGRLSFLRWKCLLTAFDALALAGLVSWLAGRLELAAGLRLREWDGLRLLAAGRFDLWALAAGGAVAGLAALGAARATRALGRGTVTERNDLPGAARALFLTQAATAFGLVLGPIAGAGRMRDFVITLSLVLAFAAVGGFLVILGSAPVPEGLRRFRWLFLYLALAAALIPLGRPLTTPGAGPVLLVAVAFASPLAHLALHRVRAVWFLRPWRPGHLFDRSIPLPLRLAGGFLQATAALPFGGMLLPLALPLRAALASRWQREFRAN